MKRNEQRKEVVDKYKFEKDRSSFSFFGKATGRSKTKSMIRERLKRKYL